MVLVPGRAPKNMRRAGRSAHRRNIPVVLLDAHLLRFIHLEQADAVAPTILLPGAADKKVSLDCPIL